MPPATVGTIIAIVIVLALAVREDILRHRIPNELNAAAFITGLGLAVLSAGASGGAYSLAGAVVGCMALLPFYLLRGMGAGDVKLLGATGAFLGPGGVLLAAALTLIAGGVLAVALSLWRVMQSVRRREASQAGEPSAIWRAVAAIYVVRKERFPYAVAVAAGVALTLWLRGSLGAALVGLGIG